MRVVITGSTKGLGFAIAKKFLESGDSVLIGSRNEEMVTKVLTRFDKEFSSKVIGKVVDVTDYTSVENFAQYAIEQWGGIDIWVNNAGTSGYSQHLLHDQDPEVMKQVITTNIVGTMYGCKAAILIMEKQGSGHIFNMEGMGSTGRIQKYMATYGTSKNPIPYLTKSLILETKDTGIGIHRLSPGMVLTDMIIGNTDKENASVINILADTPVNVADFLVPRMRDVKGTGKQIRYLTNLSVMIRFFTRWRYKNRFFDEDGKLLIEIDGVTKG